MMRVLSYFRNGKVKGLDEDNSTRLTFAIVLIVKRTFSGLPDS